MKKGGGAAKGKAFERHVAHMVIDAFAPFGITKTDCYRTPLSGGHFAASKEQPSDLQLSPKLKQLFPFAVECKSYRQLDWPKLLAPGTKGDWVKWWAQVHAAVKSAKDPGDPILVFRQNRSAVFVLIKCSTIEKLDLLLPKQRLRSIVGGDEVVVATFQWLLRKVVLRAKVQGNEKH